MQSGNNNRSNYYKLDFSCNLGDTDFNGSVNVLDVINLINIIIGIEEFNYMGIVERKSFWVITAYK